MTPTTDLPEALQRLLDIEAIRLLKHKYAELCDKDYDPDGLAALFTENAVWNGGIFGTYEGRDAIRGFFAGTSAQLEYAIHYVLSPSIEVDGDRATGSWYLWQAMVLRGTQQALWLMAKYDDTYVREADGWKFASVHLKVEVLTPYEEGPGKIRIADVG